MDLGIRGRLALVTGASSGLGRACALALAAEGVRLAVGARRMDLLEAVAAEARAAGSPDAQAYALDLSDPAAIDAMLAAVRARQGDAEILVANSGPPKPGMVTNLTLADWDAAYGPTMRSLLQVTYGVLPAMRRRRWGRIVNLSSSAVKTPIPNLALSNAFRAGLLGALKTLSREVAADGVTINVIATGKIETDRARSFYSAPGAWEKQQTDIPFGRFGKPEEFAPLVAFLCGDGARYISGTTIAIDGGLSPTLT
ncbi:MAG: SDR family oxidoreductase [Candidatus Lustribacter sp.]